MKKNYQKNNDNKVSMFKIAPQNTQYSNRFYRYQRQDLNPIFKSITHNQRDSKLIVQQQKSPYSQFNPYYNPLWAYLEKRQWNNNLPLIHHNLYSEHQFENNKFSISKNERIFNMFQMPKIKHENNHIKTEKTNNIPLFKPLKKKCKICNLNKVNNLGSTKVNIFQSSNPKYSDKNNLKLSYSKSRDQQEILINNIKNDEIEEKKVLFNKIHILIMKLFNDEKIIKEDLNIHPIMKNIIIQILIKKNLCKSMQIINLTANKLNKLKIKDNFKRTEEKLKFIFKKCIKHLQKKFKQDWKNKIIEVTEYESTSPISKSLKFDYTFYSFYFKEISEKMKQPIEKFFHFRNWKNRTNKNIPKSITKTYVNYLKMNKQFIKKFIDYMENDLINDIFLTNTIKITNMIENWQEQCFHNSRDLDYSLNMILKKFKKKYVKLPWSYHEIQNAINESLKYLNEH